MLIFWWDFCEPFESKLFSSVASPTAVSEPLCCISVLVAMDMCELENPEMLQSPSVCRLCLSRMGRGETGVCCHSPACLCRGRRAHR